MFKKENNTSYCFVKHKAHLYENCLPGNSKEREFQQKWDMQIMLINYFHKLLRAFYVFDFKAQFQTNGH